MPLLQSTMISQYSYTCLYQNIYTLCICVCVYMYTYISSGLGSLRSEWACYPIAFKIRVSCVGKLREDINTARARVFEEFNRPGDGSFYKQEHGYFSICLSVYLCIYLPNYLSYLTVYLSILRILSHTCLVCVHKYTYIYTHMYMRSTRKRNMPANKYKCKKGRRTTRDKCMSLH